MLQKILVPTDFSDYSERTISMVPLVPGVHTVFLVHAMSAGRSEFKPWFAGRTYTSPIDNALRLLQEEKERLEAAGYEVHDRLKIIDGGSIADTILKCAQTEEVGLIMIGARGKGIIDGFLLGSVSAHVLRHARTNILITHYPAHGIPILKKGESRETPLFSRVLCPTDFSKPAIEVYAFIKQLSAVSELILVHVVKSAESEEELSFLVEDARRRLSFIKRQFEATGILVKTLVRVGNPVEEICNLAEEEDVSLVIMSRRGKNDYIKNIPIGSIVSEVAHKVKRPLFVRYPLIELAVDVRELEKSEFGWAEEIWRHYHGQKADPEQDRIVGVLVEGTPVGVARCKRHPDGLEVDGVFILHEFRGRGYARLAVEALVDICGTEVLYMHSTLELIDFYRTFGFEEIDEDDLPPTIRDRFEFALGDMEGVNVQPMRRMAS